MADGSRQQNTALKTKRERFGSRDMKRGHSTGEVCADVSTSLCEEAAAGRAFAFIRQGSVLAQQVLFRARVTGDWTKYISIFSTRA